MRHDPGPTARLQAKLAQAGGHVHDPGPDRALGRAGGQPVGPDRAAADGGAGARLRLSWAGLDMDIAAQASASLDGDRTLAQFLGGFGWKGDSPDCRVRTLEADILVCRILHCVTNALIRR